MAQLNRPQWKRLSFSFCSVFCILTLNFCFFLYNKAKQKRRLVLGLREVTKHLKLRKLKCVIISSNVERIRSEGGLDETLSSIIALCQENQVHLVFALKRQRLGKVLLKKVPVSIVGIFNYNGADDHYNKLIELTQRTKQAYTEKWEETREKLESQQLPGTNMNDLENNQSCEADNTIDSVAENSEDDDEKVGGDNDSGSANEDRITGNDLTIEDV
ncbi:PREDICTED: selenocysteine insertion sequence-binding protein 2-like [Acropora digitifera]|uniref:selenocysteine insertion sequence-binding protein 2-like n=1 Tax=Acropora digitifera TaxID=70779 RepID=UPI00077A71B0|nr:PREDICTED: selenocysteine insertion sequence-binding protein 2-like [Acropora digitifera]